MICGECGAEFDEDLFAGDPTASFICPLCGTLALDARPLAVTDRGGAPRSVL
jgi:predicted RNA-binding Zn-ribbon protein involved in translation (DUF1610 family)